MENSNLYQTFPQEDLAQKKLTLEEILWQKEILQVIKRHLQKTGILVAVNQVKIKQMSGNLRVNSCQIPPPGLVH